MEHLDARLGTIAAMVPRCRAVADIGCDHGLLVAALLEGGRCDYGIAADINPMPLEKARQELTRRGLLAQSECRLTNGLCGIAPVGVDAVVIAGMGGELIADILSRWDYTENPAITYLLQPMTRPVHLRQWLYTHRFTLQEERCCRANGKLYTVLQAQYTGCATEETPAALYFGALDLENDPLAGEYREQVLRLREEYAGQMEVLLGIEQDSRSAQPVPDWADYWIGSVHNLYDPKTGKYHGIDWDRERLIACRDQMFGGDMLALTEGYYRDVAAMADRRPAILGHIDLVTKLNRGNALFDEDDPRCRTAALEALHHTDPDATLLEVNTGAISRGYRDTPYPAVFLLREWRGPCSSPL